MERPVVRADYSSSVIIIVVVVVVQRGSITASTKFLHEKVGMVIAGICKKNASSLRLENRNVRFDKSRECLLPGLVLFLSSRTK